MSMDTLFHGTAGDLELYTAEEVVALRNSRIFKSSNTGQSTPKLPSLTSLGQALPPPENSKLPNHCSKVKPDSSTRKRDYKSSPRSYRCPVSMATESHEDLDKSEHKREAAFKQLHQEIDTECRQRERSREHEECNHSKSRNSHLGCTTGYEHSPALKHGRSVDPGASGEHPHLKEQ